MAGRWPFTAEKIATRLALIAPFLHARSTPLPPFRLLELRPQEVLLERLDSGRVIKLARR